MSIQSRKAVFAGIGLMLLSVFLFSLNDAVGKWLVASYSVGEILLIRGLSALALLAPFLWREGIAVFAAAPRPRLQVVRALISTTEVVCFFWSVGYLPLADVITFYLAAPIYVTALAPFVLGEHVGWRRWAAVLFGALAMGGLACLNRSLKIAAASIVVPYQYTMIVWGVVLGFLVFGDKPRVHVLAGAAIIVAAGLFIFWREQKTDGHEETFTPPG